MKHLFNTDTFKKIVAVLLILLIIKTLWFVVEILWLPAKSIDLEAQNTLKPLYYRVKLTPNKIAAPIVHKVAPVKQGDMKDIHLLALYNSSDTTIVTVMNKGKTKVLSRGEDINGFVLEGAGNNYATFSKNNKTYKIILKSSKIKGITAVTPIKSILPVKSSSQKEDDVGEVTDMGDHKVIDRSLLNHYATHMDDIYKNIGITEVKNGRNIEGFRLTFVRKDSPFDKLGVQRDDVIKEINGQPITSYNAAFEVYKNIKNVENLSLKINRGNEEMELEYEIN